MQKRYIVLDQNVLRGDELRERLCADKFIQFVLPDLAFLEMNKSAQWEQTLRRSLEILSSHKNRVFVSHSVSQSLRTELTRKTSVQGHSMLYREATYFVREILQSVQDGADGHGIARIKSNPDNHREALEHNHLQHEQNKAQLAALIDVTKSMVHTEAIKRLRSGRANRDEKLDHIFEIAAALLPQILVDYGFTKEKSRMFLKRKPMLLRYMYLKVWLCIDWVQMCGFDSLPSEKVTNDELDHEYILTATFFDGLFSAEGRVNDAYQDLLRLLSRISLF